MKKGASNGSEEEGRGGREREESGRRLRTFLVTLSTTDPPWLSIISAISFLMCDNVPSEVLT